MASIISSSQVDSFRALIREIEPYPLEVLEDLMIDDNRYDENRIIRFIYGGRRADVGDRIRDGLCRSFARPARSP